MSGDVIVGAAKCAHDWVDYLTLGATVSGAGILLAYTFAAFRQVSLTARALREAEKSREETAAAALRSDEATKKSNKIAKKALTYGKRSWLIPEIDERSPFKEEEGSAWKVAFYISNTGSVPGVMINAHARVDTDPKFERSRPQMSDTRGAIILPGAVGERGLRVKAEVPADIPEEQVRGTVGPSICVYCYIQYRDVFSDEWESKVAWMRGKDGQWYHYSGFDIKLK